MRKENSYTVSFLCIFEGLQKWLLPFVTLENVSRETLTNVQYMI